MQRVVGNAFLFKKLEFTTVDRQKRLFTDLKQRDSSLYRNLDANRRTLFVREGGKHWHLRPPRLCLSLNIVHVTFLVDMCHSTLYGCYPGCVLHVDLSCVCVQCSRWQLQGCRASPDGARLLLPPKSDRACQFAEWPNAERSVARWRTASSHEVAFEGDIRWTWYCSSKRRDIDVKVCAVDPQYVGIWMLDIWNQYHGYIARI